jgi:hypothetical protein
MKARIKIVKVIKKVESTPAICYALTTEGKIVKWGVGIHGWWYHPGYEIELRRSRVNLGYYKLYYKYSKRFIGIGRPFLVTEPTEEELLQELL